MKNRKLYGQRNSDIWCRQQCADLQQFASFPLGGAPLAQLAASKLGAPGTLQAHNPAAVQQEGLAGLVSPPVALDAECRSLLSAHTIPLFVSC